MLIHRGELVSCPAALPRLMRRDLIHDRRPPTPSEMDEVWDRDTLDYCREKLRELRRLIERRHHHREKVIHALKSRAWDLACRRMAPGHA